MTFIYNIESNIHERKIDMLDFIKSKIFFSTNTQLREFIDKAQAGKNICKTYLISICIQICQNPFASLDIGIVVHV